MKNNEKQEEVQEGEEIDIGGGGGTLVLVEDNCVNNKEKDKEPYFMQYIKNMDVNYVNNEYLKEHFQNEEEEKANDMQCN